MTPIHALATSVAYVINADKKASVEEKARLLALLHKHVSRGDMGELEMREISTKAFETAKTMDVDRFLDKEIADLSNGQRLGILINLYDIMLADGLTVDGEVRIIQKFERAFDVDSPTRQALREVLLLKNDPAIFTSQINPRNESSYALKLALVR